MSIHTLGYVKHNNDTQLIRKIIFYHVIQINQSLKKMMKEKSNRHLGCKTTHMVGWLCHVVLNTLLWLVVNHMSPIYYSYQSLRKSMLPTPYNFSSPQANYFLLTIRLLVIDQIVGSTRRSRAWHKCNDVSALHKWLWGTYQWLRLKPWGTSNTYFANIFGPELQDPANFDSKRFFFFCIARKAYSQSPYVVIMRKRTLLKISQSFDNKAPFKLIIVSFIFMTFTFYLRIEVEEWIRERHS